jgi:hypothetical protein
MATNLGSLAVFLTADTRKYKRGMTSAQKTMAKFSKAVTIGLGVATTAMVAFGTKSIKAFTVQEDALESVKAALRANGDEVEMNTKKLAKFASEIQQVTVYGDELILKQIALQRNLGVSADKLEDAAKMTIGLAAATGKNIESLGQYVAMAMQGDFTMLRRYIPALRQTTDATEQLKIVTEFAANGFKVAKDNALTTSGSIKQLSNSFGDLQESIGDVLVDLLGIKDNAGGAKNSIDALAKSITKNKDDIVFSFKFIVINAKAAFSQLWNLVKNIADSAIAKTWGVLKTIHKILKDLATIAIDMGKEIWKAMTFQDTDFTGLADKHREMVKNLGSEIAKTAKTAVGFNILDGVGDIDKERADAIAQLYKDAEKAGDKAAKKLRDDLLKAKKLKAEQLKKEIAEKEAIEKAARDSLARGKDDKTKKQDAISPIIGAVLKGTSEALRIESKSQKSKEVEMNTKKTADNTEKIAKGIESLNKAFSPIGLGLVDVFGV